MIARDFIKAMLHAKDRNQKIAVLENYCGYDPNGNFGDQEMRAVSMARQALKNHIA